MQRLQKVNSQIAWMVLVFGTILIWLLVLKATNTVIGFTIDALKQVPTVITIETIVWFIFYRWGWKLRLFRKWFVRVPLVEGQWNGKLKTNWKDPVTGNSPGPIDASLEVRQTFTAVSCKMRTGEMVSESFAADFMEDPSSGTVTLIYSYSSVPNAAVRHRSPIHYGTAKVEIQLGNQAQLHGQYWTDRNTSGDLDFVQVI